MINENNNIRIDYSPYSDQDTGDSKHLFDLNKPSYPKIIYDPYLIPTTANPDTIKQHFNNYFNLMITKIYFF